MVWGSVGSRGCLLPILLHKGLGIIGVLAFWGLGKALSVNNVTTSIPKPLCKVSGEVSRRGYVRSQLRYLNLP